MNPTDLNTYEPLSLMMSGKKPLKEETKLKRKFLYTEGLIRFLELYCNNELGSGRVDIQKVCLWVNSPFFENQILHSIRNIQDVFKMLEQQLLADVPLYRLLDISEHLKCLLEEDHRIALQNSMMEEAEQYPCLKCIWYQSEITPLGMTSKCERPKYPYEFSMHRSGFLHIKKVRSCKYCTTVTIVPETIAKMQLHHYEDSIATRIHKYRTEWNAKYDTLDNSVIPVEFENLDMNQLADRIQQNPMYDFGRIFNNKMSYSDIYQNLQECVLLEGMISFVEIYAKTELGSNFIADIAKIAEKVHRMRKNGKLNFKSAEEVYHWLEEQVLSGKDMTVYCKYSTM